MTELREKGRVKVVKREVQGNERLCAEEVSVKIHENAYFCYHG
jgi:hypothetical protein